MNESGHFPAGTTSNSTPVMHPAAAAGGGMQHLPSSPSFRTADGVRGPTQSSATMTFGTVILASPRSLMRSEPELPASNQQDVPTIPADVYARFSAVFDQVNVYGSAAPSYVCTCA